MLIDVRWLQFIFEHRNHPRARRPQQINGGVSG